MFNLQVYKNRIVMTENDEITAGSSNVYPILWEFNADWAGLTKEILFTVDADLSTTPLPLMRLYLDDNGMCQIPFEVLKPTWVGHQILAGACGTRGAETVLPTVWISLGTLKDSTRGRYGTELTPSEYDQLKKEIGNLDELDTDAKSSLVAAINEVNSKVESGIVEDAVQSDQVSTIIVLDRSEYDDIPVKDEKTLYLIRG